MFDHTFVNGSLQTKKPATVLLSAFLQVLVICTFIGLSFVYTEALPHTQLKNLLIAPGPPRFAVAETAARHAPTKSVSRIFVAPRLVAPSRVPERIVQISDAPPTPEITASPTGEGIAGTAMPGVIDSMGGAAPPLSVSTKPADDPGPMRVGGNVESANLVYSVRPAYPPLARATRIQGSVEFTATISREGTIKDLKLVGGHPLLVNSARQAVSQWRYRPTLLNGKPVEVVTDITVNFTLTE